MATGPRGVGIGGSGGGLLLRVPPDIFTAANRSGVGSAEAARDAAITNVSSQLQEFTDNPNLAIILVITGSDPDTTVYQVRRGNAWADVTNVVRGPGPTPEQVAAGVAAGVKPFAKSGGPLVPENEIDPDIARDSEIATAIANIKGGVEAAYDTLKELADKVVIGVAVRNGRIVLTHEDGTTTDADATGLQRPDSQINTLIQAALRKAVEGNTETGIDVTYNNDGTLDFVVTGGGGGGITIAQALAAILAGTGVNIDRSRSNQITISSTATNPVLDAAVKSNTERITQLEDYVVACDLRIVPDNVLTPEGVQRDFKAYLDNQKADVLYDFAQSEDLVDRITITADATTFHSEPWTYTRGLPYIDINLSNTEAASIGIESNTDEMRVQAEFSKNGNTVAVSSSFYIKVGNVQDHSPTRDEADSKYSRPVDLSKLELKTTDLRPIADTTAWQDAPEEEATFTHFLSTAPLARKLISNNPPTTAEDFDGLNWYTRNTAVGSALQRLVVARLKKDINPHFFRIQLTNRSLGIVHGEFRVSDDNWDYYVILPTISAAATSFIAIQKNTLIHHTQYEGELGEQALGQVATIVNDRSRLVIVPPDWYYGSFARRLRFILTGLSNSYPGLSNVDKIVANIGGFNHTVNWRSDDGRYIDVDVDADDSSTISDNTGGIGNSVSASISFHATNGGNPENSNLILTVRTRNIRVVGPYTKAPNVLQAPVDGGDANGSTSKVLPENFDDWTYLVMSIWRGNRIYSKQIRTSVIKAQTADRQFGLTRIGSNNVYINWTLATRTISRGDNNQRIIHMELVD